ncbi:hypothetical protein CRENBAI_015362 [Crenichthys baileyi]|uniref:Uncharacterized protein n=1 Tax=Crenichthys baileyi TaxID=28760 RepID=A0AAV9QRA9_9TELE
MEEECAHVWVYDCSSATLCPCVCARACSLLVKFNPSVRGVTAPQHTRRHSCCSTLTFYSSTLPTHTVHFCPKRAIKETNVFPKISWLPALHTNAMPSGCKY